MIVDSCGVSDADGHVAVESIQNPQLARVGGTPVVGVDKHAVDVILNSISLVEEIDAWNNVLLELVEKQNQPSWLTRLPYQLGSAADGRVGEGRGSHKSTSHGRGRNVHP